MTRGYLLLALLGPALLATSCGSATRRADGLDVSTLSQEEQNDYAVFAQRCSKCHSLARPFESGIDTDDAWALYVTKMRRMPSSGISAADTVPILRFLHRYDEHQWRSKGHPPEVDSGPVAQADGGAP